MTEESIRLTIAELWAPELLALVEGLEKLHPHDPLGDKMRQVLTKIDALEPPERHSKGAFW